MNTKKIVVKVNVIGGIEVQFYEENIMVIADSTFPTLVNFSNAGIGSAYLPVKTGIQEAINTRLMAIGSPLFCYWSMNSNNTLMFQPKTNITSDNRELIRDAVLSLLDDFTFTEQENFGYVSVDLSIILNEVWVCE